MWGEGLGVEPFWRKEALVRWHLALLCHVARLHVNELDEPIPLHSRLVRTSYTPPGARLKLKGIEGGCSGGACGLLRFNGQTMGLVRGGNHGGSSSEDSIAVQDAANSGPGIGLVPSMTAQDRLKASYFPATSLKIGTWERTSRQEGDLVVKCYYRKRKLCWELLENGLKSKLEIQWSDISAMKASCPENLPGSLDIEVSLPPLFFRETNFQPRKHTLWQRVSDFTGGQATICKRHSLQFPEGVLNRHYEKLVQSDPRLKALVEGALSSKPTPDFDHSIWLFDKKHQHMPGHQQIGSHTSFSRLTGVVAILWVATITVLCCLPHDQAYAVSSQTLKKYTPVVVGGVFVLALVSWLLSARKWFVSPIPNVDEKDKV